MTLPTMVSVALTRGIARRLFLPSTAEEIPPLGKPQFVPFLSYMT
jgi:hypothetical protein